MAAQQRAVALRIAHLQQQPQQDWLHEHGYPTDPIGWQNLFNAYLVEEARRRGLPPLLYKALIAQESQFIPYPNNPIATGMAQITNWGVDMAFNSAPPTWADPWIEQAYQWTQGGATLVDSKGKVLLPKDFQAWQDYYRNLSLTSQATLRSYFIPLIDGLCNTREVLNGECAMENAWRPEEWKSNLAFGMVVLQGTERALREWFRSQDLLDTWEQFWQTFPPEERWKVQVATYNAGQNCVGSAILSALDEKGWLGSWMDIAPHLTPTCRSGDEEVHGVWGFLGGEP